MKSADGLNLVALTATNPDSVHTYRCTPSSGPLIVGCDGGVVSFLDINNLKDSIVQLPTNCMVSMVETINGMACALTSCGDVFVQEGNQFKRRIYGQAKQTFLTPSGIVVISSNVAMVDHLAGNTESYVIKGLHDSVSITSVFVYNGGLVLGASDGTLCVISSEQDRTPWIKVHQLPITLICQVGSRIIGSTTNKSFVFDRDRQVWDVFVPDAIASRYPDSRDLGYGIRKVYSDGRKLYMNGVAYDSTSQLSLNLLLSWTTNEVADSVELIGVTRSSVSFGNYVVDTLGQVYSMGTRGFITGWYRDDFQPVIMNPVVIRNAGFVGYKAPALLPNGVCTWSANLSETQPTVPRKYVNQVTQLSPPYQERKVSRIEQPTCLIESLELNKYLPFNADRISLLFSKSQTAFGSASQATTDFECTIQPSKVFFEHVDVSEEYIATAISKYVARSSDQGKTFEIYPPHPVNAFNIHGIRLCPNGDVVSLHNVFKDSTGIVLSLENGKNRAVTIDHHYSFVTVTNEQTVLLDKTVSQDSILHLRLVRVQHSDIQVTVLADTVLPILAQPICAVSLTGSNAILCSNNITVQCDSNWTVRTIDTTAEVSLDPNYALEPRYALNQAYLIPVEGPLLVYAAKSTSLVDDDYLHAFIFSTWPNPTTSNFTCKIGIPFVADRADASIKVVSLQGDVLKTYRLDELNAAFNNSIAEFVVPTSTLPSGSYLLVLQAGGQTVAKNVVVVR